jgi:hypothetical protein
MSGTDVAAIVPPPERGSGPYTDILFDERGMILIGTHEIRIFSYDGTLEPRRRIMLEHARTTPVLGENGMLYVDAGDWILSAFSTGEALNHTATSHTIEARQAPKKTYGVDQYLSVINKPDYADVYINTGTIDWAISTGSIGQDELLFISYLMKIAGAPSAIPGTGAYRNEVNEDERLEALALLGRFGSRETLPFLIALYNREKTAAVKIAIINTMAMIGVDPDFLVLTLFNAELAQSTIFSDEQVVTAMARCVGDICRFYGTPYYEGGAALLRSISTRTIFKTASRIARAELNSLITAENN